MHKTYWKNATRYSIFVHIIEIHEFERIKCFWLIFLGWVDSSSVDLSMYQQVKCNWKLQRNVFNGLWWSGMTILAMFVISTFLSLYKMKYSIFVDFLGQGFNEDNLDTKGFMRYNMSNFL
ncbi:hypothetical protein ACJX0J_017913 [Zea mays]